ncbi:helix-turn-helix domain-containing protein [Spirosoma sp. RP8]|uniref:Helix-turn-helix domain-containing protein n=2 Tax=Spirosoma liriopis TaxID=2937440 RepID=A0ABT0HUJ8_9BACT|nr:helix-turn-helix domain-containing protein [Spirosoma liriopis]
MEFTNAEGAKRLKAVAVALGLRVNEMGAQAGIEKQQMYDWTSGKLLPKWSNLVKIAEAFPQVSAEFLLRGKGSVLNE